MVDWSLVTLCSRDTMPIDTLPVVLRLYCHISRKFSLGLGECKVLGTSAYWE